MARPKKVKEEDRRPRHVKARLFWVYAVDFPESHELGAFYVTGRTPEELRERVIGTLANHLPRQRYDVELELINPDSFEKAGVNLDLAGE